MAYQAEIQIGVKGARQLQTLTDRIKDASNAVQGLNDFVENLSGSVPKTFDNIASAVQQASRAFDQSISNTKEATVAAYALVKAEAAYNAEIKQRNELLSRVRASQGPSIRGQRLTETQQQGQESLQQFFADAQEQAKGISINATNTRTAWSTFFSDAEQLALDLQTSTSAKQAQIKRNWSVFFGDAAEVASDLQSAANARNAQIKLSWSKFFGDAAEVANDLQAATTARAGTVKQSWTRFFADAAEVAGELQTAAKARSSQLNRNWNTFFSDAAQVAQDLQASSAAKKLNVKTSWVKFFSDAEELANELRATAATKEAKIKLSWGQFFKDADTVARDLRLAAKTDKVKIQRSWNKFFDDAEQLAQDLGKGARDAKAARTRRRQDALSSGLIGGAFPLLFGQGIGAAAGGGIGGALGGALGGQLGFALSLVGTQFGTFADQIVAGGATLGQALDPLTADLDALAEAAGYAGTETQAAIETIRDLGSEQQALEAATALLAATVGNDGVNALQEFGENTADLGREFARTMSLMQAAAAALFSGIAKAAANLFQEANDLAAGLKLDTPEAKALQQERATLRGQAEREAVASGSGRVVQTSERQLEIDKELARLGREKRLQIEGLVQSQSQELKNAAFLEKFGVKSVALTRIQNQLEGQKRDFTNDNYVSLLKEAALEKQILADKKARAAAEKTESGQVKNDRLLAQVITQNEINYNNEILKIERQRTEAIDRRNKKVASAAARANKQSEREIAAQRRILQAAEDAVAVQQNKLDLARAEGTAAKALLQFAVRKTQIEQKYAKQVEAAQKAGGPSAGEAITKLDEAQRLALLENEARLSNEINKISEDALKPLNDKIKGYEDQVTFNETYRNLIKEGINPELAKELANIDLIYEKSLDKLDAEISSIEALKLQNKLNEDQIAQLDSLIEKRGALETKRSEAKTAATAADAAQPGKVQAYVDQLQQELNDTEGMIVSLAQTVENEIGSAMSSAITGVITGTQTVEEAMSTMFANIGKAFIDMATQMIAKALVMKALGILSGGLGGGGEGFGVPVLTSGTNFFRANGGPVRPNGTYMVGEQGPELLTMGNQSGYVHSNTSEAMDRYRAGRSSSGGGSLNVNYNVTSINGMNFVTEEQFRAGMTKAAKDGAKMGEAGTFKSMRNSRSSRARAGL